MTSSTATLVLAFLLLLYTEALLFFFLKKLPTLSPFVQVQPNHAIMHLGLDIGLITANELLELEKLGGHLDLGLEEVLGVQVVRLGVGAVLLEVQANGGAGRASAGETDNDAAARGEGGVQTLVGGDRAVKIGVGEVAGASDGAVYPGQFRSILKISYWYFISRLTSNLAADEVGVGDEVLEDTNDLVGTLAVDILVVVTGEEGTTVLGPEVLLDLLDGRSDARVLLADTSNDVQPGDDGPETILLTNVVASSAERLLTTDGKLISIEEGAEELPAGGDLVAVQALLLGNQVDGAGGRHGAGQAVNTLLLEVGDEVGVVGNDGQGVAGGDESVGAVDHVAVTITVGGSTEGDVVLVNDLDEGVGVGQVGVGVAAVEVGAGDTVLGGALETKLLLEDGGSIRTSDTVQAVKEDLEIGVGLEELLDEVEIEDVLEHLDVVNSAIDDLNLEGAVGLGADGGDVDIGDVGDLVGGEGLGGLVDLVGDGLGGGATVGKVVLDTEVVLGTWNRIHS